MEGEKSVSAQAVDAFETALVYSHDNFQYRLKLTDALVASGQPAKPSASCKPSGSSTPGCRR